MDKICLNCKWWNIDNAKYEHAECKNSVVLENMVCQIYVPIHVGFPVTFEPHKTFGCNKWKDRSGGEEK